MGTRLPPREMLTMRSVEERPTKAMPSEVAMKPIVTNSAASSCRSFMSGNSARGSGVMRWTTHASGCARACPIASSQAASVTSIPITTSWPPYARLGLSTRVSRWLRTYADRSCSWPSGSVVFRSRTSRVQGTKARRTRCWVGVKYLSYSGLDSSSKRLLWSNSPLRDDTT